MKKIKINNASYLFYTALFLLFTLFISIDLFPDSMYGTSSIRMHYSGFIVGVVPLLALIGYGIIIHNEENVTIINIIGILTSLTLFFLWAYEIMIQVSGRFIDFSSLYYYLLIIIGIFWFYMIFERIIYLNSIDKIKIYKPTIVELGINNLRPKIICLFLLFIISLTIFLFYFVSSALFPNWSMTKHIDEDQTVIMHGYIYLIGLAPILTIIGFIIIILLEKKVNYVNMIGVMCSSLFILLWVLTITDIWNALFEDSLCQTIFFIPIMLWIGLSIDRIRILYSWMVSLNK